MTLFLPSYKFGDLFHCSGSNQGCRWVFGIRFCGFFLKISIFSRFSGEFISSLDESVILIILARFINEDLSTKFLELS